MTNILNLEPIFGQICYKNSNLTLISIINTCNNAPSFDDNGFPASSKKDKQKHGLGLKSVNRIANKYNGSIKMYYENQSKTFHTIIIFSLYF